MSQGAYIYQAPPPECPVVSYYLVAQVPPQEPLGPAVPMIRPQEGWACPRCCRIYGPRVDECKRCNEKLGHNGNEET